MRLIDADALKEKFTSKWILDRIDQHPTADVVEVVRCKDCAKAKECGQEILMADGTGRIIDYCSCGERKDD